MTATSGQKCLGSSNNLDPLGLLVKTLLTSQTWNSTARYLTWKVQITKSKRSLYRLSPSKPRMKECEPSLLPTPTASDGTTGGIIGKNDSFRVASDGNLRKMTQNGTDGSIGLGRYVQFFPTPTMTKSIMWPTPRTKGMCGGTGSFQTMIDLQTKGVITETERKQMTAGNGGQLNTTWVEWLMGFPIGWTELKD